MAQRVSKKSEGQILMMTLVLLALVGVVLTGVSRASLSRALMAEDAAFSLQRRWGEISCRAAFLSRAEWILSRTEDTEEQPTPSTSLSLTLGSQLFKLILVDEQAKININTLLKRHGRQKTEDMIRSMTRGSGDEVKIHFNPHTGTTIKDPTYRLLPVGSVGQVFSIADISQFIGDADQPSVLQDLTCWGNGQVNFKRASTEVVKYACTGLLSLLQIKSLTDIRDGHRDIALVDALRELALSESQLDKLTDVLSDTSQCHSIWIVSDNREKRGYSLTVSDSASEDGVRTFTFEYQ